MNYKEVVSILSDYNEHIFIMNSVLKPKRHLILIPEGFDYTSPFESLRDQLSVNSGVVVEGIFYKPALESVREVVGHLAGRQNLLLNLSGERNTDLFIFQHFASKRGIPLVVVNVPDHQLCFIDEKGELNTLEGVFELSIEEMVSSSGAEIIHKSTETYERQDVETILGYICANYEDWKQVLRVLKDRKRTLDFMPSSTVLDFSLQDLPLEQMSAITRFLSCMEEQRILKVKSLNPMSAKVVFRNLEIKRFLIITGSWLEAITYKAIKGIRGVDDTQSGVVFLWDRQVDNVRNELDVVASLDSQLICISCKDTDDFSTNMLNELEVYAEHMGGENTMKLFVTSNKVLNPSFINRAREMGIDLVYFDGRYHNFVSVLNQRVLGARGI